MTCDLIYQYSRYNAAKHRIWGEKGSNGIFLYFPKVVFLHINDTVRCNNIILEGDLKEKLMPLEDFFFEEGSGGGGEEQGI